MTCYKLFYLAAAYSLLFLHCTGDRSGENEAKSLEAKANEEYNYSYQHVDSGYKHAPTEAREAWLDRKFGMRIIWGPYAQLGLDASWPTLGTSNEFKDIYATLWQVFDPEGFNADEWAQLAEDAGMKYFVFTTKHHDGFSMFDTKTTVNVRMRKPIGKVKGIGNIIDTTMHYSIMETQYKTDIVKAITDAFRKRHMGIGFYYSNTDWNDRNQRFERKHFHYDSSYTLEKYPENYRAAVERQTMQLTELCTNYGTVDQIDFDHGLPPSLWKETVKMIKKVRQLQPNALFRNRGLGNYGDFETPEHWIPDSPDDPRLSMLWQAIEHYGTRWAWQPNDTYKGKEWILQSLIDCASKGGNFMVGVSPMANGKFDQRTQDDLRWTGRWLQMNGEAIYATRGMFMKDDSFRFTRSKDSTIAYAIHTGWFNDRQVTIKNITARPGGSITMPGVAGSLQWRQNGSDLVINVPARKPDCEYAYVFRIPLR
jgi:alpha-L-fucosidase